jgi:hypothetical protein
MIVTLSNAAVKQVLTAELWRCVALLRAYPGPLRPQDRPDLKLRPGLVHASARLAKLLLFATRNPNTTVPSDWDQGEGGGAVSTIFEFECRAAMGSRGGSSSKFRRFEYRTPIRTPTSCGPRRIPKRASEAHNLEIRTG